ncbi:MAG: AAA family ATPase [Clostridia bacterium]|nr:AAA family ATPase [Clostridia bacterium]
MVSGIMIMGSPGAGKTTLGKALSERLGYQFLDIDDYIWRKDTEIPFTVMYPRAEKISRLMEASNKAGHFVMAGSMDSFHEHFDPFFDLVVYLTADKDLRVKRVHERELALFGPRILVGGDMHEAHQKFLRDVAGYDDGFGGCTSANHEKWLASLSCPILRLDGSQPLDENIRCILEVYNNR